MSLLANFRLFAQYNQMMNARLYQLADALPRELIQENKGAFFGSIQATLTHLLAADLIWLNRFAQYPNWFFETEALAEFPKPTALDQSLYDDFAVQFEQRKKLDALIVRFIDRLSEADLERDFHYRNMKGLPFTRNLGSILFHVFNHQTHHRGQTTTLLSQCGVDIGVTDFFVVIPDLAQSH